MLKLYEVISDKSIEEIKTNEVYYLILILHEISLWEFPNEDENMDQRKRYFECINNYASKHKIEISCNELLDSNYKDWLKLDSYLIDKLKGTLLNEI